MTEQEQEQAKQFEQEYNKLCIKHKLILTFQPQWKQSQDTGTWSLVIVPMLAKFDPPPKSP